MRSLESETMKRKIIFLDIDGVLVNREAQMRPRPNGGPARAHEACVAALNHILRQTGALIVVSSTWRAHGFNGLCSIFESWGIQTPWGFTPDLAGRAKPHPLPVPLPEGEGQSDKDNYIRGDEIQTWINCNLDLVGNFVILDDDKDMKQLLPWLVKTDSAIGLTMADAERAIKMLNEVGSKI